MLKIDEKLAYWCNFFDIWSMTFLNELLLLMDSRICEKKILSEKQNEKRWRRKKPHMKNLI